MTQPDPNRIDQAIIRLMEAADQTAAEQLLLKNTWLITDEAVPARIKRHLVAQRQELWTVAALYACRALLRRCGEMGVEATLPPYHWPLAETGPLARLLQLPPATPAAQRLQYARLACEALEPDPLPEYLGLVHYHQAMAYQELAARSPAGNLPQAITHFEEAILLLRQGSAKFFRRLLARAYDNLGALYLNRRDQNRREDVETALGYFADAEKILGPAAPELFNVLMFLGDAHIDRIRGERLDNIEQALHHYRQAYALAEQAGDQQKLAGVEHNLAVAYRVRLKDSWAENYEEAKKQAESALARLSAIPNTAEAQARTLAELATIYGHRRRNNRQKNLTIAIEKARQALEFYTPESHPRQWALVQQTLGNLYCDTEQYEKALDCFDEILNEVNRKLDPLRWAETMNNLGTAYAGMCRSPQDDNYREAVQCYQQALEVRRPEVLPDPARRTALNWGRLAFSFDQWPEAYDALTLAQEAGEALYEAGGTEAGRRVELAESAGLAAMLAFCLLQLNRPAEALVQLERGKTRLLTDALALGEVDLARLPAAQRKKLQAAREKIRTLEADMRQANGPDETTVSRKLVAARDDLRQIVAAIRQEDPDFMPTGLTLPQILALLPAGGALVAPVITARGSAVFVVPHGAEAVTAEHVKPLPGLTTLHLQTLLVGATEEPGWLRIYARQGEDPEHWRETIPTVGQTLWQKLMEPVEQQLAALGLSSGAPVLLLPPGGLSLLPLHAAWRWVDGQARTFLDDHEVTYAPSAYACHISQRKIQEPARQARRLLAVVNPTQDLAYATLEGRQVVKLFSPQNSRDLANDQATIDVVKTAVNNQQLASTYFHFACHGKYNWQKVDQSGLVLADESLTLAHILSHFNLDAARLVTLSACETGLTEFQETPDEYIGLPAGFLQAGAPGVVSTLWAVNDLSTMLLMERFYHNLLQEKMAIAAALRQAQLWLRDLSAAQVAGHLNRARKNSADEATYAQISAEWRRFSLIPPIERPFAHPFYWAAFTFSGA